MTIKTKISQLAPKYILTIMDDDIVALEKRKTEIWEAKRPDIAVKSFRKGHVPREHAENVLGYDNLYEDVVREVVARGCKESNEKIVGVGQAFIDILAKDQPVVVRIEVWLEPAVHLTDSMGKKAYEGVEFEQPNVSVEAAEVEAVIQRARDAAATTKTIERESARGDVVVIDFQGKLADGTAFRGNAAKDYQVILGAGILLPEFEAQLVGVKIGQVKDVSITFPDTWPAKELAGKQAIFTTTIKEVKERTLSEVNDDFAKQIGYDSLVIAREKMREDLKLNKEQQTRGEVDQQLLLGLMKAAQVDPIPQCMIQQQTNALIQNMLDGVGMTLEQYLKRSKMTQDDLVAQHQQAAASDVRARLVLRAISEAENLVATPEEEEQALQTAQKTQFQNMDIETLRKQIDRDALTANIRVQKAMRLVREKAVARVKPVAPKVEAASQQ
jgi:trigger factor